MDHHASRCRRPIGSTVIHNFFKLYRMKQDDFASMQDYISSIQNQARLLENHQVELHHLVLVSLMIHNLSDDYALTKALLQDKDKDVLTFEYVRGKLLEAEKHIQEQGTVKAFSVTQRQILDDVQQKGKPKAIKAAPPMQVTEQRQVANAPQKRLLPPCSFCKRQGHNSERCWERRTIEWKRNNPDRPVPDFKKQDTLNKRPRGPQQQ